MVFRKPLLGTCFVSLLSLGFPGTGQGAGQAIEEIVVTGSYIRKDSFDSSSPVTIIDEEQIQDNASPNLGEVMVAQTFNYGSDFQTNTVRARPTQGNETRPNLRGLGEGATLQLFDGKRSVRGANLNNYIPQIAIQRIDILKDGASALYGADAVAGVVNIIPNKQFEGIRVSAFHTSTEERDLEENNLEVLIGNSFDRGHFTMAGAYRNRTELTQNERPKFARSAFQTSSNGNPGVWRVPGRDASGAFTGTATQLRDPGCGVTNGPGGTDITATRNHISGSASVDGQGNERCLLHFGEWWNYMNPQNQWSVWSNLTLDLNDHLTMDVDVVYARLETDSRGSAHNSGGNFFAFPIVRGEHPGNPYRAFADLNGNGAIDGGEQLFARDADGDGVPDRDPGMDANGDGVPDVILAAAPFDPASGIPFNEDVAVHLFRPFAKLGVQPSSLNDDGSNTGNGTFDSTDVRLSVDFTYDVPDSSWEIQFSNTYEQLEYIWAQKAASLSSLIYGLNGQLINVPGNEPTWFNPFSTTALSCVDRVCRDTGVADFANTQEVMDAIAIETNDVLLDELLSFSLIATGDVMELPSGTMAAAVGFEYRDLRKEADLNSAQNRCDWYEGGCGFDYFASQDVAEAFVELAVPVFGPGSRFGPMDLQIAGRYSSYGGEIGSDFNPKFALLWQPTEVLSVRGSWSSAFIAPTLEDLYEPEDCELQQSDDLLAGDTSQSFRVACVSGNPNLAPETADVWNVGASLSLLDGALDLGIDYAVFEFEDRIVETGLNQVLTLDYQRFLAWGGTPGDTASVDAWLASGLADPAIQRDTTGALAQVTTTRLNASEMKHKAIDLYVRYNLYTERFGAWNVSVEATYVDEYTYDIGLGIPPGDAAGSQNEQLIDIPPIPEWRMVSTLRWSTGNHSAMIRARWIDGFDKSFNSAGLAYLDALAGNPDHFDPITYVDVNYKYRFESLLFDGQDLTLEIGGKNVFDKFPRPTANLGAIESYVHDIRGAMWYGRIVMDL